ncbi:MAG TPA: dienelactone hydrolase family protein [Gemmatimonadales bacterium]|nr:dienelactone hydrolase family protein [Gemmatimonadales bacterium]
MHPRLSLALGATLFLGLRPAPTIATRTVEYTVGTTVLQSFIAWDSTVNERRPGVLVVPEWWGLSEHMQQQAERVAEAGYVSIAVDLFGKGKVAMHPQDAQAFVADAMRDPQAFAARFSAALAQLKQDPHVDTTRIAAIGFCLGGTVALEAARAGAPLAGVASFHGMLGTKTPAQPGQVKAQLLVLTGEADPFIPADQVEAFKKEMHAAGVHFDVIVYPGAKHGFTNPDAATYGMPALAYDPDVARQSWATMLDFLKKVFASR